MALPWLCKTLTLLTLLLVGVAAKNVLLILGDDVGFESGVYGNRVCKTPHIDSLAKRSLVFDNGFTSVSSCSPSRSALLTGLPQHQNGMFGLENSVHHFQSFPSVRSLSSILLENGIYSGIIGKKHVGPLSVYPFNFSRTEMDHYSVNQVGRNITLIKLLVREFIAQANGSDFFLYVAFHDAHRCGATNPELGVFCERFGDASIPGMGVIADWVPTYYTPSEVEVPYFVPDTEASRRDIAAQYKTVSRLDQGIGQIMKELSEAGVLDDTLVILSSDNGIPFPSGRTNLYDPGLREPFIVSHPTDKSTWGKRSDAFVTLLDVVPTVLDWYKLSYPNYSIFKNQPSVMPTGKSLLPMLHDVRDDSNSDTKSYLHEDNKSTHLVQHDTPSIAFASQSLHEITMYYPMRVVRTDTYKLIQNINYLMPFPIDQDFYVSPTFQDILNKTSHGVKVPWYKTLGQYYYRPQWELYALLTDPYEVHNVYGVPMFENITRQLKNRLKSWQNVSADPWICAPSGVLEASGAHKEAPACLPLYNGLA